MDFKDDPVRLNATRLLFDSLGKMSAAKYIEQAMFDSLKDGDFVDRVCRLAFTLKRETMLDFKLKLAADVEKIDVSTLISICNTTDNLTFSWKEC